MALVISDRVKETTTTTGTGTVTLAGAVTGFRAFSAVLSNSDTTYYAIVGANQFEVGIGTYTSGTLSRDTVLSSSNSNALVEFSAGSKNVFITQPADKAIYQDASGNVSGLDTDNVSEGSTNLYFTNERVDDRVGSLLVAGDNVTLSYDDAAGTLTISATEDNLSNNDTDDLAEGATNLYYTSARANADFDTRLATKDTDDLSEGATNLYYTDARADARVNLQTGANLDLSSKSTSDLSEGTNLYYTDTRFDTRLTTKTTDNLTEGSNLYFTNERVDDRVSNLLQDGTGISFAYDDSNNVLTPTVTLSPFSTTNLSEGTNLYFTNERVDDRVANLLTAGSNITLTYDDTAGTLTIAGVEDDLSNNDTDDLSEGATNLYFTNERVDDRVSALVQNGTGISWSYNDVSGTLTPTVSLSAFSTSDLSEGTNLYYTTARFDSAFSGKSTSDLSEGTNLYYTTARFDTAFSGKDTDDLTEGSSNLYYTDTRANAAIDTRVTQSFVNALNVTAAGVQANSVALGTDTTGNYIATIAGTANKITVTGSGSESATVTLTLPDDVQIANDLTVAGDLTVNGATTTLGTTNLEVSDNLFELNSGLITAPVNDSGMLIQRGTSDNAIFMWDESADKFALGTTTSDATVTGNITITTGSLVANLEGNVTGNVTGDVTGNVTGTVSSISNHDTDDLSEGASNLYYTTARFDSAFSGKSTSDLSEGTNLYYTDTRFDTRLAAKSTSDLSEGTNLYYTTARFDSAFSGKSTSDLSEGTNLYLTQERVEDYVGGMVSGNTETGIAVTYDDTNGKLNFVIDTLNQDTTGNAATATALATARNFSLTGDVTASAVSFDGTANVALSTSIAANTVGITELNVTDGTNGQVLTTDGAGNLSFSSAASAYGDSDVESYLDGGTSTPTFASATVSGDFTVDTSTLKVDSTNNRVGIANASPAQALDVTGNIAVSGTVDGRDIASDGSKLDGIESGATADQTAAEIRTLVESATDSNVFTDADHSKLNGIESGATADQTASEILTAIKTVDGSGSGLDADLLDGISSASFLRSDATDTFTTLNGTQLNLGSQVQLRESTDRPDLLQITSSTSTWAGLQVRNSSNEGRWSFMTDGSVAGIYDDENGKWHIQMDENGETRLYNNATERITATSVGADVLGQLYVDSTTDAKFILQGSADPYMVFKEGTTDKCHIGWDSTNTRMFFTAIEDNSGGGTQGNFIFKSGDADDPVKIALAASDSDIFGYIYGSHANDVGFLDDDASWAYRISTDSQHEWRVNDVVLATLTSGQLTFNTPSTINGVVDLYVDDQIISTGDTDTYLQFHAANQFRIVTGGTEMLEVNDTYVQLGAALNANDQQLINVEDIGLNDQIFHDGDTNTYIQFHAADQWRVVTGGTERLEVNNSLTTIATPLTVQGENNIFSNSNAGIYFTNGSTSPTFASHGGIARSAGASFHVSGSAIGDLCISAESGKHIMFGDANTQNARLEDNGNFIAAGSVTGSSDVRLKDNVQTIQNALEKTMALRGVTFTRNDIVDSPEKIGVIAQEVEEILPQVVVTAEDEDAYKSVAYGEMVALLIEATKEQQNLILSLQARIEALEGN